MPKRPPEPLRPQPNPQTLRDELLEHIRREGLALFQCESVSIPVKDSMWWDVEQNPRHEQFFQAAQDCGAKMMYFFEQSFAEEDLERLEDSLEISMMPEEENRRMRRRLADFRGYVGFLSRVGVGFAHGGKFHWFDVYAQWYFDYLELLEEAEMMSGSIPDELDDDEDEEPPIGGYYSRN